MIHVVAGTDTYGRVKKVAGTPIVTKFAMLQMIPLVPLQSFYKLGDRAAKHSGIPLMFRLETSGVFGIPLASVDVVSVLIAYARALFATLTLVGSMILVPAISYFMGENLDEFAQILTLALGLSLAIGIVGGLLTYVVPVTPRRERAIRAYCAEVLGVAADPARVTSDMSARLASLVADVDRPEADVRASLIGQLIETQAKIAQSIDVDRMEIHTDEVLAHLGHADRLEA